jgi:hypothetical protein
MYVANDKVHIVKGLMTYKAFEKSLHNTRKIFGDDIPYVLHFRISTQAGNRQDCTHPFPLSSNMDKLRKLKSSCKIGIAHNGIISLTSSYLKDITYSDTMKFITDYLSLIIKSKQYYDSKDTLKLIDKLCGSKLAILDNTGHCEIIGTGWINDNGILYSNSTYKPRVSYSVGSYRAYDFDDYYWSNWKDKLNASVIDDDDDEYEDEYETETHTDDDTYIKYDYEPTMCPYVMSGDDSRCYECVHFDECWG